jgi:hypothetical protein
MKGNLRFRFRGMNDWADVPHVAAHNCYYLDPLQCGPRCFTEKKAAAAFPRSRTVTTTSETMLTELKHATTERFSFKDQGELNEREFTGCFATYDRKAGRVPLSCDRSVTELLKLANFEDCNLRPSRYAHYKTIYTGHHTRHITTRKNIWSNFKTCKLVISFVSS